VKLVKTHGSLNEIFALDAAPSDWESPARLRELLEPDELAATWERLEWLRNLRALPELVDDGDWPPYPWPLV